MAEKEKLAQKLGKFETTHKAAYVYFLVSLTLLRFSSFLLEHKIKGHVYDERLLHSIFSFLKDHTIECCEHEYTKYCMSRIIPFQRLWLCATLEPWFVLTRETIDFIDKSCESLPQPVVRTAKTKEISRVCNQVVTPSNAYAHAAEPRGTQRKMLNVYRYFCLLAVLQVHSLQCYTDLYRQRFTVLSEVCVEILK